MIIDECGYEGNLPFEWGSFTGFEMVHRFWQTICRGGFGSHGETFHRADEVLWGAKGGKLYGESASRLAFMKDILYQLPVAGRWRLWATTFIWNILDIFVRHLQSLGWRRIKNTGLSPLDMINDYTWANASGFIASWQAAKYLGNKK